MTNEEAKHKLDFLKKAYQKLIDEKVDSGKLVGDGVRGEWEAETPLDEVYKDMIESLDFVIKVLEQQPETDVLEKIRVEIENHCGLVKESHCRYCSYCNSLMGVREILEIIDKNKTERRINECQK